MAKDKEKLFKGIDDKAITFQRAVFIVCNLKRLIKRPKKDEKHGSSSGTRKRSNEPRAEEDEMRAGYAAARRAARVRDPVRRAFTLPTMLCNSFAVAAAPAATCSVVAAPPADHHQYLEPHSSHQMSHHLNHLLGLHPDGCHAHPRSSSSSPGRADHYQGGGGGDGRLEAEEEDWLEAAATCMSVQPAGLYPNRAGGATCRQCQQQQHQWSYWQDVGSSAGGFSGGGGGGGGKLDAANRLTTSSNSNVSSLSCLITPVRRANLNSPPTLSTGSQLALSERRDCTSTDSPTRKWSPLSPQGRHDLPPAPPPTTDQPYLAATAGAVGAVGLRSACCPVWLHLMGQLDARMGQTRDQLQFAHLLGPPSPLPYLLAPSAPGEQVAAAVAAPAEQQQQQRSGGPRVLVSVAAEPTGSGFPPKKVHRRSSNESLERRCRRRHRRLLVPGAAAAAADRQEEVVGAELGGIRLDSSQSTTTTTTSSSSDENVHVNTTSQAATEGGANKKRQQNQVTQQDQESSSEQVRMKRFSSALCLADQQRRQPPVGGQVEQRNQNHRKQQQQQQQQQVPGEMRTTCQVQAPLEDPILLARQRRLSASNQGSLNVDQQALFSAVECNQLERAKSILKEAKVNVNSLNNEKLTCLDIAVLMRNVEMVQLLQQHNAKESSAYLTREGRANQLYALYTEARRLVEDLSRSLEAISPAAPGTASPATCAQPPSSCAFGGGVGGQVTQANTTTSLSSGTTLTTTAGSASAGTGCGSDESTATTSSTTNTTTTSTITTMTPTTTMNQSSTTSVTCTSNGVQISGGPLMLATGSLLSSALFEEKQRQLQYWRRRLDLFMHMRYEFERLQTPSPPELIVLQVVGESSLGVKIVHSLSTSNSKLIRDFDSAGDVMTDHHLVDQQQQQQRLPANLLRTCADPKCSHWLLAEFGGKSQVLSSKLPLDFVEGPAGSLTSGAGGLSSAGEEPSAGDRLAVLRQQQRLAVFNQLLAQQLTMLCHQQRHADTCRWSPGTPSHPNHSDHHSIGLERRAYRQTRPFASIRGSANTCNTPDRCELPSCTANVATATTCPSPLHVANFRCNKAENSMVASQFHAGLGQSSQPLATPALDQHAAGSIAYRLLAGGRMPGERGGRTQRHLLANQPKELSLCASSPRELNHLTGEGAGGAGGGGGSPMIITKYKLEWSLNEQMNPVLNSMIVYKTNSYPLECQINGLTSNQAYYVRVSAGNHKGFSETRPTTPVCLIPSSWRQVEGNKRRKYDEEVFRKFTKLILLNKHILDDHQPGAATTTTATTVGPPVLAAFSAGSSANKSSLINMLLLDATAPSATRLRQEEQLASEAQLSTSRGSLYPAGSHMREPGTPAAHQVSHTAAAQQSSLSVRKNLKNFFQSNTFKFHKLNNQNKRGLYLTTVIYHSPVSGETDQQQQSQGRTTNKIVVTNDDRLPIIEVINDLVSPGALMSDFYWLLKINGTQWMDIKRLRQQLQKSHSSSTLHLRIKLLSAIEQIQLALNMEDIGRLFYKPIQAHDGSMVICTCKQVASTKLVSNLSIKWTQQHKLISRHLQKISESVQSNQQQHHQQPQVRNRKDRISSSNVEGLTLNSAANLGAPSGNTTRLRGSDSGTTPIHSACDSSSRDRVDFMGRGGGGGGTLQRSGDFRLCDHCQFALVQRRCTMASGSSNSSLASSSTNESQLSGGGGGGGSRAQSLSRCTCAGGGSRTISSALSSQQHLAGGNLLLNTSSRTSKSASGTRSGSMISTTTTSASVCGAPTPTHYGSLSARQSQSQHLSNTPKSSTYLMLASLSLYDLLLYTLAEIVQFDRQSTVPLTRGLYLGFVQLQTTVESMRLLVPRARPNMVPCARIRDNSHVSREEWQLLKQFGVTSSGSLPGPIATPLRRSAGRKPDATRASDPSLWSAESNSTGDADTPKRRADSPTSRRTDGLTPGFERDRAKSVSPGLLNSSGAAPLALQVRDSLSVSSERLCSEGAKLQQQVVAAAESSAIKVSAASDETVQDCAEEPDELGGEPKPEQAEPRARQPSEISGCSQGSVARRQSGGTCSSPNTCSTRLPCRSPTTSSRLTAYSNCSLAQQAPEETFVRLVGSAAQRLLAELKSQLPKVSQLMNGDQQVDVGGGKFDTEISILQALNDDENNRIYHLELIELSNQVSFVLLIPSAENVCPVTSHEKSNILADNKEYMLLPLQIFEIIHISTYEPDLLGKYSRLSAILETDLIVAQHDHRQAFSSNELKSTKSRVSHLQDMVSIADEFWRQLRWIVDVVSFARDKSSSAANGGIKLGTIWRYFELSPSPSYEQSINLLTGTTFNPAAMRAGPQTTFRVVGSGEQATTSGQRFGHEVKRTISARGTREQLVLERARAPAGSAPGAQIPGLQRGREANVRPVEARYPGDFQVASGARRHSGDAALGVTVLAPSDSANRRAPIDCRQIRCTIFADDQIRVQEIRQDDQDDSDSIGQQLTDAGGHLPPDDGKNNERHFRRMPCEPSDDEEAIYAYHITLRDATRAAAQRKSSQQSIRAFVDDEPISPGSLAVGAPAISSPASEQATVEGVEERATVQCNEQAPKALTSGRQNRRTGDTRKAAQPVFEGAAEHATTEAHLSTIGSSSQSAASGSASTSSRPVKRRMRPTNPFLDSYDLDDGQDNKQQ